MPPPDILPRAAWRGELVSMMLIQEGMPEPPGAGALVPLPPDWLRILRYYESRAPEALPAPEPWPAPSASPSKVAFKTQTLAAVDAVAALCQPREPEPGISVALAVASPF